MRLFHHQQGAAGVPVAGLAETAAARGWQPAPEQPLDSELHDTLYDVACALYGSPGVALDLVLGQNWRGITFHDAFRFADAGRTVTVANARAGMPYEVRYVAGPPMWITVCAVELAAALAPGLVQPRRYHPMLHLREEPTGNPAFDQRFLAAVPHIGARWLTAEVQQRLLAHEDWVLLSHHTALVCVTQGALLSADDVVRRVGDVLDLVDLIPSSVVPRQVDRSVDDLAARIARIHSVEDAIAFLQGLSDGDRERLARSDTPLAGFADVRTPEEAMARFQSLDRARQVQLMGLFMRASGAG